ncbi:hypothetical protein BJ170DRAFT_146549 [Xylariales sp. AK1849]|nr:hypothetical protein BJ170DRAFT_146549 [Xylariales sp. AK1849]
MSSTGDIGPRVDGITWTLTVISGLFLGTRLYVKVVHHRSIWFDDYFLLASWIFLVIHASISSYGVSLGFGKHTVDVVPMENIFKISFLVELTSVFTLLAAAWSKTSFAITLLRLTKGPLNVVVWVIIFTLNFLLLINAIYPFLQCRPAAKSWNPTLEGSCLDNAITIRYSIFACAYSATMDFILAFIPWAVITGLKMKRQEKIGVGICMSLGFAAGATSVVRCVKIPLLAAEDFTSQASDLAVWTVAEIATTIMAASIPVLRVFVRKMVTSHPGTTGINRYHQSETDGTFKSRVRQGTHTTSVTTHRMAGLGGNGGGCEGANNGADGRTRGSKDKGPIVTDIELGLGPEESNERIVRVVETVAVDYGYRSNRDGREYEFAVAYEMRRMPPFRRPCAMHGDVTRAQTVAP